MSGLRLPMTIHVKKIHLMIVCQVFFLSDGERPEVSDNDPLFRYLAETETKYRELGGRFNSVVC